MKKNFVPKSRKTNSSTFSLFNTGGDASLNQKADSTFRTNILNSDVGNNFINTTGSGSISRFDTKVTALTVQIGAGIETELRLSEENYVIAIIDEIFKTNAMEFGNENMDDYCVCLDGKALSPAQKIGSLNLSPTAKLTLEKKQSSQQKRVYADEELTPKLTKANYETEPSRAELARMTETELKNVRNFTVKNQHAKIVFLNTTDVTGLDLDDVVQLNPKSVDLYEGTTKLPEIGKGLNKEAQITYFNFGIDATDFDNYERKVKKWARKIGVNFIGLNEGNDSLTISVEHF
jgi:hypothetical protein